MRRLLIFGFSLSLLAEGAIAQTVTFTPEQAQTGARSQGAKFSIDRGVGKGRIDVECAGGEATRGCIEAVLPLLEVLSPEGGSGTGVVYSTSSIKCGSTVYEVSTGTSGGNCSVGGPADGPRESIGCNDGQNEASANCQKGCGATSGSGSCTIKSVP